MAPEAGCTQSDCEVPGQRNGFRWRFQRGREGLEQHYGRAGSAAKRNPTKPLNLSFNEYAFFFFPFSLRCINFLLKNTGVTMETMHGNRLHRSHRDFAVLSI